MVRTGPTERFETWAQNGRKTLVLVTEWEALTFTAQETRTNGFLETVLGRHASATESILTDNRYKGGVYQDVACYDASCTVLKNDKVRELKESLITSCYHQ